MSKIFDELERLEGAGKQAPAVRQSLATTAAASADAASGKVITVNQPPPLKREEAGFSPRLAETAIQPFALSNERAKRGSLQVFAFDASMVLLALAIFAGICVALGSASLPDLARNAPWLAVVPVSLAGFYWMLSKVLRRGTPGVALANGEAASDRGKTARRNRGLETLGRLSVPAERSRTPGAPRRPLLEDLALAGRILGAEGVLDVQGSVSVRDDNNPNRVFMAGSEITEYDVNGSLASGSALHVHPDRFLHCEIYRARPDVMAIVHTQAPELIPFAASSVPLLPIIEMADFLNGGVPVFESRSIGPVSDPVMRSRAIGQAIAENLGDKAAALIRGRGAVIVASSLQVAVGRAYYMNMNARLQAQSILLGGTVKYLESSDQPTPNSDFERAWDYWKQKSL